MVPVPVPVPVPEGMTKYLGNQEVAENLLVALQSRVWSKMDGSTRLYQTIAPARVTYILTSVLDPDAHGSASF